MLTCPSCHQPASKRDGHDAVGRQRYACHPCGRDFTERSSSAFTGSRWPAEVILLAVRWSLGIVTLTEEKLKQASGPPCLPDWTGWG